MNELDGHEEYGSRKGSTDDHGFLLEARGLSKTFGERTVLSSLDFTVAPGTVHALVGQNGSGKSTFIKILSGYYTPDPGGRLKVKGQEIPLPVSHKEITRAGISFVHQDLGLVPALSVVENVMVRRFHPNRIGYISWRAEKARTASCLERVGIRVDPEMLVQDLDPVEQALVAIARGLDGLPKSGGVLILDEPTAYLPRDGVDRLFDAVDQVRNIGFGIVLVSHRLEEVRRMADDITVLRDSRVVLESSAGNLSDDDLVTAIVGRALLARKPAPVLAKGATLGRVSGLYGPQVIDCSFEVREGEVVGLAGLIGMGQNEVVHLLFGAARAMHGTLQVGDSQISLSEMTPRKAMARGISFLPGDRRSQSAVAVGTVSENLSLPILGKIARWGFLRPRVVQKHVLALVEEYDVRPAEPNLPFGLLSGGNQQKALVGKWMQLTPRLLMFEEPTAGVDVGGKSEILRRIRSSVQSTSAAAIIASSDFAEFAEVCDRVLVFRDGRIVGELNSAEISEDSIAELALRPVELVQSA